MGTKIEVPSKDGTEYKPSATIKLTDKEGNFISGTLVRRFESDLYKGKYSYLIKVENLEGKTIIWNKETKSENEMDVQVGDNVFLKGTTYLDLQLKQVKDGSQITVTYIGKGTAKKGQKAPFKYDVVVN